ncbi:MAG: hypothetical protein CVU39_00785 [Chloroflexi bacterium HGW-Chloroflexi-10]|nr:MAG: hypothetical protein CVU39_00785 [Chloroflexi bacterium HGW-Chloroflexi-10]
MRFKLVFLIVIVSLLSLGCNLMQIADSTESQEPTVQATAEQPAADQAVPQSTESVTQPQKPEEPSGPPSVPVSLRKGLSTLDSYKISFETETTGPTAVEVSRMKIQQEYSSAQDSSITFTENYEQSIEEPEPYTSQSYSYQFGTESCSGSAEDGYEFSSIEPAQKEMQDILTGFFDLEMLIESPEFVGSEMVNGVQTNHFQFALDGLGVESGVEVVTNQGEYWLAVDGQYLVRYSLLIETRPNPENLNHLKVTVNLEDINQPKDLVMPQACLDAKNATE